MEAPRRRRSPLRSVPAHLLAVSLVLLASLQLASGAEGAPLGARDDQAQEPSIAGSAHRLVVRARGDTGDERMAVRLGGVVVGEVAVSTGWVDYPFDLPVDADLDEVQVAFVNDAYLPPYDRNLWVDYVEVGGFRFETEAPTTFSSGSWVRPTGCAPGWKQSERLSCNGWFSYRAQPSPVTEKVVITTSTPEGIPATVALSGPIDLVVTKPGTGTTMVREVEGEGGTYRVVADPMTIDGQLYVAEAAGGEITVDPGDGLPTEVSIEYVPNDLVSDLHVTSVTSTSVGLAWSARPDATVVLTRSADEIDDPSQGVEVSTADGSAEDPGLDAGREYHYSLFARVGTSGPWVGPTSIRIGTVSEDPGVAAYAANEEAVMLGAADFVSAEPTGTGVRVVLAGDRPVPLYGAAVILPVTPLLPGGFLGVVTGIGADNRTLDLTGGSVSDAFDYISIAVPDLGVAGDGTSMADESLGGGERLPLDPSRDVDDGTDLAGTSLPGCSPGGGVSATVSFDPSFEIEGHFNATVSKYSLLGAGIPTGATMDTEVAVTVAGAADIEATGAVTCGVDLPSLLVPIISAPVPLSVHFAPAVEVGVAGAVRVDNLGLAATAGFRIAGHLGWDEGADFTGAPILNAVPFVPTITASGAVTMKVGGELIIGPGAGTRDAGAIIGIQGAFNPVDASIGPVFPIDDPRFDSCLEMEAGANWGLGMTAKAWLGAWSISDEITLDALQWQSPYGQSPWYLPEDCELTEPGDSALGDGVTKVSDGVTGGSNQWGYLPGLVPGKKTWVLSTGDINSVVGSPGTFASTALGGPGDADLAALAGLPTYDAVSYTVVLVPTGSTLHVRFVFASEEYPEYVGSDFNDVMAVYVDGTNCALVPGTTEPVSVNTINADRNSTYFVDNASGAAGYQTVMDGLTTPLECAVPVVPGEQVTVKLAVADTSDRIYDSAVALLDQGIWSD